MLTTNLQQVEALKRKAPPSANMTESIQRIKDVIEETRNFVNRVTYFFQSVVLSTSGLIQRGYNKLFYFDK